HSASGSASLDHLEALRVGFGLDVRSQQVTDAPELSDLGLQLLELRLLSVRLVHQLAERVVPPVHLALRRGDLALAYIERDLPLLQLPVPALERELQQLHLGGAILRREHFRLEFALLAHRRLPGDARREPTPTASLDSVDLVTEPLRSRHA